ncbi:MAG: HAD hydrolase family protein [Thermoplasmata archaeon]|uniref:HAD hydrolase family protein n=1 Tax=Candidatus Sysuiplasma superficiale TaxID=2823368 RepID=A0A8J8CBU9_9ARCH|nr:HAD hydrolase family protein [Candidatus Sysuiplasma superficiale]MBX8644522.1 HAD hydrolase family protein [Candidatus Sysuiplasma superficiale]MCL4346412.1 HAD hydrolase family protein [Candidatus Thermoplasmatota archaeon]
MNAEFIDDGVAGRVRAIATDYDRTLTDLELNLRLDTVEAVDRAAAAGIRIIIVSGRGLPFMLNMSARFSRVDALVAENGAVIVNGGHVEKLSEMKGKRIAEMLKERHVHFARGQVISYIQKGYMREAEEAVSTMGGIAKIVRNLDSGMVLPDDVDKDVGLLHALRGLGIRPDETLVVGDGENDLSLYRGPFIKAALTNSVDEIKRLADFNAGEAGGRGVSSLIDRILAAR